MSREARNPGLGLGGKRRLAPVAQIVLSQPEIRTPGKSTLCWSARVSRWFALVGCWIARSKGSNGGRGPAVLLYGRAGHGDGGGWICGV